MIVFDLSCPLGHRFEGWFASSDDFSDQNQRGLIVCPQCGSDQISKAPMAPAVPRKGNQHVASPPAAAGVPVAGAGLPPEAQRVLAGLARLQAEVLAGSRNVGKDFVAQSRAMHYGEREAEVIHGQATLAEARELVEEGVPVLPLPFPVASPEDLN